MKTIKNMVTCASSTCRTGSQNVKNRCAKCKSVTYCSRACQVEDWKHHKLQCFRPTSKRSKYVRRLEERFEMIESKENMIHDVQVDAFEHYKEEGPGCMLGFVGDNQFNRKAAREGVKLETFALHYFPLKEIPDTEPKLRSTILDYHPKTQLVLAFVMQDQTKTMQVTKFKLYKPTRTELAPGQIHVPGTYGEKVIISDSPQSDPFAGLPRQQGPPIRPKEAKKSPQQSSPKRKIGAQSGEVKMLEPQTQLNSSPITGESAGPSQELEKETKTLSQYPSQLDKAGTNGETTSVSMPEVPCIKVETKSVSNPDEAPSEVETKSISGSMKKVERLGNEGAKIKTTSTEAGAIQGKESQLTETNPDSALQLTDSHTSPTPSPKIIEDLD